MTPESGGKISKKSEKKKSSKNKVLVKSVLTNFLFLSLQQKIRRRSIIIVEDYDTKEIKDVVDCESTDPR